MMNILSDKREFDRQAKSSGEPFSLKEIQFYHDKGAYQEEGYTACTQILARCSQPPVRYPDEVYKKVKEAAGTGKVLVPLKYRPLIVIAIILFMIVYFSVTKSWTTVKALAVAAVAGVFVMLLFNQKNSDEVRLCLDQKKGVTLITMNIQRLAFYYTNMENGVEHYVEADGILIRLSRNRFNYSNTELGFTKETARSSPYIGKMTAAVVKTGRGAYFYILDE